MQIKHLETILGFNNTEKKLFEDIAGKGEMQITSIFYFYHNVFCPSHNTFSFTFTKNVPRNYYPYFTMLVIFSSTGVGQRAYVMVRCLSCVRPLTFSLNIFSETTYPILIKFHRNVPAMVLFRISWENLISSKTLVAMAAKLKNFWNLWKSSCQKP